MGEHFSSQLLIIRPITRSNSVRTILICNHDTVHAVGAVDIVLCKSRLCVELMRKYREATPGKRQNT